MGKRKQPTVSGEVYPDSLLGYIDKTDLPILEEFCVQQKISLEEFLESANDKIRELLKLLETKKRATLERMIYSGQLNATIGAHLIKYWRECESREAETVSKIKGLLAAVKNQAGEMSDSAF